MREIVLVNQYTGPLFIDVANAFAKKYKTTLITGYVQRGGRDLDRAISVKKFIAYNRNSAANRLITWTIFSVQVFFYLLISGRKNLFFVSNPPFAPFVGYLLNQLNRSRYFLLIYDIYPDALVSLKYINKDSLICRLWAQSNRRAFENAANVFTISASMAAELKKYMPNARPVEVVESWADNDYIKPVVKSENPFSIKHQIAYKLTAMYSGNMGLTHDLESVLKCAILLKYRPDICFLLIGDGAKKAALQQMAVRANIHNVLFLPFQPAEILPFSLASGDIAIVSLGDGAESLSVPSKTYSMLAAGCALLVIARQTSEIARLVYKYDCGRVVAPGDVEGIARFIEEMKRDESRLIKYKENARKASFDFTCKNADRLVEAVENYR